MCRFMQYVAMSSSWVACSPTAQYATIQSISYAYALVWSAWRARLRGKPHCGILGQVYRRYKSRGACRQGTVYAKCSFGYKKYVNFSLHTLAVASLF